MDTGLQTFLKLDFILKVLIGITPARMVTIDIEDKTISIKHPSLIYQTCHQNTKAR